MEDTEKQKLIAKIMNEVKDPVLRDKLLRELTSSNNQGTRRYNRDSVLLKELKSFGLNERGVKEFVNLNLNVGIIGYYISSAVFILIGLVGSVKRHFDEFGMLWLALGIIGGVPSFIYARKLSGMRGGAPHNSSGQPPWGRNGIGL
jgi:hypothetical protein